MAAVAVFFGGILFWGGLNWSLEITNTQTFCVSCHEMREYVFKEYKKTGHYTNHIGIRASCPDCHVPKEWAHNVTRKVWATNELFHWMRGSIDTAEKFEARRGELLDHQAQTARAGAMRVLAEKWDEMYRLRAYVPGRC